MRSTWIECGGDLSPSVLMLALLASGAGTALAQEGGLDGHGPILGPASGEISEPFTVSRAGALPVGAVAASLVTDLSWQPLVRITNTGDEVYEEALLDQVVAANLGLKMRPLPWLSAEVSTPLFLTSSSTELQGDGGLLTTWRGPSLGDVELAVPITLLNLESRALALSIGPTAGLPTGSAARWLGSRRARPGAELRVASSVGRLHLQGALRTEAQGTGFTENLVPGLGTRWVTGLQFTPTDTLGVGIEARGRTFAGRGRSSGAESTVLAPLELLLGGRARITPVSTLNLAVASYALHGPGAADARVLAGYTAVFGAPDAGTEPGEPSPTTLVLADPRGAPVSGARIRLGEQELGVTDDRGTLVLPDRMRWSRGLTIEAPGFAPQTLSEPTAVIVMEDLPVSVPVRVRDQEGQPVAGRVGPTNPAAGSFSPLDERGEAVLSLSPGTWDITIEAEGAGTQQRRLAIDPREEVEALEVFLLPRTGDAVLDLTVLDAEEIPVSGAAIRLDGVPIGSSTDGGRIVVEGLSEGVVSLEVLSRNHREVTALEVDITSEATPRSVTLEQARGSVRVRALGPSGPAGEVSVRFEGPTRIPATPLGSDGERIFPGLEPGTWEVWAISPTWGLQRRDILVDHDDDALLDVVFQLQPPEGGAADLRVLVVDPDGRPLPNVSIAIDGRDYGMTANGGAVEIAALDPGPRNVQLSGEHYANHPGTPVFLLDGQQEIAISLGYRPGALRVRARHAEGPVRDGAIRLDGPTTHPGGALNRQGEGWFFLDPGSWSMLAASPTWGLLQHGVLIDEEPGRLSTASLLFPSRDGGPGQLIARITDREGQPVAGAEIMRDGVPVGRTDDVGVATVESMVPGRAMISAGAGGFRTSKPSPVELGESPVNFAATLDRSATSVLVRVTADGVPVTDASVRFAGPEFRAPVQLGSDGIEWVVLGEGTWHALVASPSRGLAERQVTLLASAREPGILDVQLPAPTELGDLVVRLRDPDGGSVAGARVALGESTAQTSSEGIARFSGLLPGSADLAIEAEAFEAFTTTGLPIVPGPDERTLVLDWKPISVDITVKTTTDVPVAATLSFDGPEPIDPITSDDSGSARVSLRPGSWTVIASAADLATAQQRIELKPGATPPAVELALGQARVQTTATEVKLDTEVPFELGQSTLRPEGFALLDEVAATLLSRPDIVLIEVQGHTDPTGGNAVNVPLSEARARAVVAALVARGVSPSRLSARGYGSTRPVADNDTEDGRARNRRVAFAILERGTQQP